MKSGRLRKIECCKGNFIIDLDFTPLDQGIETSILSYDIEVINKPGAIEPILKITKYSIARDSLIINRVGPDTLEIS